MKNLIYVEQYGGWWKLTAKEWRTICEGGARGEGHMLPGKCLKKRPGKVVGATDYDDDGGGRPSYYARRDGILIYSPLDWEPEDYEMALQDLEKLV